MKRPPLFTDPVSGTPDLFMSVADHVWADLCGVSKGPVSNPDYLAVIIAFLVDKLPAEAQEELALLLKFKLKD